MVLHLLAVLVLGLMCGSELNVGVFAHPTLKQQSRETHIPVRAAFAKLFGRVMPFYVAEPSHTAAIRAPEYDRMALCCIRLCHSGVRRRLLPSISRAYQQPDHAVDIGFVTARLESAGTSLGCIPLA